MSAKDLLSQIRRDEGVYTSTKDRIYNDQEIVQNVKEIGRLARFWYQIIATTLYIFNTIVLPFYRWTLYKPFKYLFYKPFRFVWDKVVYVQRGNKKRFSTLRGAGVVLASLVYVVLLYQAVYFAYDATLYLTTAKVDEVVYMSNAQELTAEDNLHSAQGCLVTTDKFECDAENSLYFRIEANGFNHIWSILNRGNMFYPDYVAAPIAPGWEKCTITSYGIRAKFLMRNWDIYPMLLSAKCEG